jgi:formate dehydrogenase subunit gamma
MRCQNRLGFIAPRLVPLIADELNLSRAEVHGVISFYHYFRQHAPGKHVIYVCRAEACQSVGARALEAHARQALAIDFHGTTPDGRYSLDRELHSYVTRDRFDELTRSGHP